MPLPGIATEAEKVDASAGLQGDTIHNFWPVSVWFTDPVSDALQTTHWLGPIGEFNQQQDPLFHTVRPLYIHYWDKAESLWRLHILPPIFNYYTDPRSTRWDVYQIIRYRKLYFESEELHPVTSFTIFPFWFYYDTGHPDTSYRGLFPIHGEVQNFLGIQSLRWTLFPFYTRIQRDGQEVRYGTPWPFIRWQTGPESGGGAFWPLAGHYWREGRYDRAFFLWPLFYRYIDHPDAEQPRIRSGALPFYAREEGPNVIDETFLFPFFGYRHEFEPPYRETRYFWPFLVQGQGEAREVNRWAPFYTHSRQGSREKTWYMWPFIKHRTHEEQGLLIDQQQFLFFLIWRNRQTSLDNPDLPAAHKTHFWPFYSHWDNGAGDEQFQLLSPFEVFFPHNQTVRDLYTPLFALYRYSRTPDGQVDRSFLWSLITTRANETDTEFTIGPLVSWKDTPDSYDFNLLHGLLRIGKSDEGESIFQFLWIQF